MKTGTSILIALSMLNALIPLSAAEEKPPTLRQNENWIIVSGNAEDGGRRGPLPWTYAIRKSTVISVCIETDFFRVDQADNPEGRRFHEASEEEIQATPALIQIATTELLGGGGFKRYYIKGLTHATAPAMLEEILEAIMQSESDG